MKALAKDHICMTHGHRQQCGNSQREGGQGLGGGGQRRGNGDICNSVNSEHKEKHRSPIFHGARDGI